MSQAMEPMYNPPEDALFDPLATPFKEEYTPVHGADAGNFDDPLAEILGPGPMESLEPEMEDPLEALMKSVQKLDIPLSPSADETNEGPFHLPPLPPPAPDEKPNRGDDNSQDDFLRMFPGAKG